MKSSIWPFTYNPKTLLSSQIFEKFLLDTNEKNYELNKIIHPRSPNKTPERVEFITKKVGNYIYGCIIKHINQTKYLTYNEEKINVEELKKGISVVPFLFNCNNNLGAYAQYEGATRFSEFRSFTKLMLIDQGNKLNGEDPILPNLQGYQVIEYVRSQFKKLNFAYFKNDNPSNDFADKINFSHNPEIAYLDVVQLNLDDKGDINKFLAYIEKEGLLKSLLKFEGTNKKDKTRTIGRRDIIFDSLNTFDVEKFNENITSLAKGKTFKELKESLDNLDLFQELKLETT